MAGYLTVSGFFMRSACDRHKADRRWYSKMRFLWSPHPVEDTLVRALLF